MDTQTKLQLQQLPELRSLSSECKWLKSKFGLSEKKDLLSSETRLIQFASIVDNLIEQIQSLPTNESKNSEFLLSLEAKITQTILPVREKLRERLREAKYYETTNEGANGSYLSSPVTASEKFYSNIHNMPIFPDISKSASQLTKRIQKNYSVNNIVTSSSNSDASSKLDIFKDSNSVPKFNAGSKLPNTEKAKKSRSKNSSRNSLTKDSSSVNGDFSEGYTTSSSNSSDCDTTTSSGCSSKSLIPQDFFLEACEKGFIDAKEELQQQMKRKKSIVVEDVDDFMVGFGVACDQELLPTKQMVETNMNNVNKATYTHSSNAHAVTAANGGLVYNVNDFNPNDYVPTASEFEYLGLYESPPVAPVTTAEVALDCDRFEGIVSIQSDCQSAVPSQSSKDKRKSDQDDNSSCFGNQSTVENLAFNDDDFRMSSRRRRRLSQIVPNPRKPRTADFSCSMCNEQYQKVCEENPWWAVYNHECPKCQAVQVPRIDIGVASNAIEIDPNVVALYGEGIDDGECEGFESYGLFEEEDECVDDAEYEECEEDDVKDSHPFDSEGMLKQEQAAKLLVLMGHARTCTGIHSSPKHAEICRSTKFLMLHIRDCAGTDINGRPCRFAWCNSSKKMLRHLTRCFDPNACSVCNPWSLSRSYCHLSNTNKERAPAASFVKDKLIYTSKLESRDALAFKLEMRKEQQQEDMTSVENAADKCNSNGDELYAESSPVAKIVV